MDGTEDHWIQEGHMWKRVHLQPRNELYIPQQAQHGPDITKLKPERVTFMNPQDGTRISRFDDQWTSQERRMTDKTWTGSTNFEEETTYKEEYITDEEDTQQAAPPAKGVKAPQQPAEQERREHNLTHLPYRSWCTDCVESKGRANNHPTQRTSTLPVIQCDFAYIEGIHDKQVIPVLTAINLKTGISMATMVQDRHSSLNVEEHKPFWRQQFYNQIKRISRIIAEDNEATSQSDNHQHTAHNHKEALNDFTEDSSIK